MSGLKFVEVLNASPGIIVLFKQGKAIYVGKLGDLIDDMDFDLIGMHPDDVKRLAGWLRMEGLVQSN